MHASAPDGRVQRELRHLAAQAREQPLLVQRPQVVQLLQRADQRLRWVRKGKDRKVTLQTQLRRLAGVR